MSKKELAKQLFREGYSCSQAVVCAHEHDFHVSHEDLFRLSEGLGGGLGHFGSVCGACSAMVLVLGARHSSGTVAQSSKQQTYEIVNTYVSAFERENRYVNCDDILEYNTQEFDGEKRVCCLNCIALACELLSQDAERE